MPRTCLFRGSPPCRALPIAVVLLWGLAPLPSSAGTRSLALPNAPADDDRSRPGRLEALVASVGAYVERFQSEMEAAVLDESYVQLLRQPCCRESRNPGEDPRLAWESAPVGARPKGLIARRQLRAEVLLVRVAGGLRVGFRDVYEVDGRSVQDRHERLRQLFLSGSGEGATALGRIAAESARFNLGQIQRTTNLPTLPLLYLAPAMHPRLHFSRGGEDEVDGVKTTVLTFREDASPTLAASAQRIDMPARGRAWVEPGSGRVRRIELRYETGARRVMVVWFRDDPRIGVLSPAKMWEWYERVPLGDEPAASPSQRAWPADLEGLATYSDLRLFSVDTSEEIGEPAE